ncbi:Acetoacetyl-CoA synthetase [Araneus ventricosus]|uniref:Acetoacetyl-CoA synthetase n=1 Tax=Araneus ventricosus TaxID=182803 RepID=A0A4Y2C7W4_ARAVE|nr:Acetoacetyl-CoA synthetase [Araneus ventricosus]
MDHKQFAEVPQIWKPDAHHGKQVKKLKKIIEDKYKVEFGDYMDFHKWSVEHLCEFWAEMWDFLGIVSSEKFETVIDLNVPMSDSPKWFEGAKLNFAENMLKYRDDRIALVQDACSPNGRAATDGGKGIDVLPAYLQTLTLIELMQEISQ